MFPLENPGKRLQRLRWLQNAIYLEPYFAPLVRCDDSSKSFSSSPVVGSSHSIKIPPHLTEIEGE